MKMGMRMRMRSEEESEEISADNTGNDDEEGRYMKKKRDR